MAEFINFQAAVDNDDEIIVIGGESIHVKDEVSLDSFIDDSTPDKNPSDYYRFTNITRLVSSTEEDAFSESNVEKCLDNNVEARNYCIISSDEMTEEEDIFSNTGKKI